LIISDVIGNDFGTIASGPTTADPSTFNDAHDVINKYGLIDKIPPVVKAYILKGRNNEIADTPKSLTNADNYLLGDNSLALEAMASKVKQLGLKPLIITAHLGGDPAVAAREAAAIIMSPEYAGVQVFILGGETTYKVPLTHSQGGGNLHLAATSMLALQNCGKKWVMIGFDSDGEDSLTDAAGAIIDDNSLAQAKRLGLDAEKYLSSFDTYDFFKKLGDGLIFTGPTKTNVADIVLYIVE
jgi:glycerate 2-kinase